MAKVKPKGAAKRRVPVPNGALEVTQAQPPAPEPPVIHEAFLIDIKDLKPHPRNYKEHPDDQLVHLEQSMADNGIYRNVVLARDNTLLAGHGVVAAAQRRGAPKVPAVRLDIAPDSPQALKVLTGDNEVMHLGIVDDRKLTELLKELHDTDQTAALVGTGYDAAMLAAQAMVTRPESEIRDFNAAAEWVGPPGFTPDKEYPSVHIKFEDEATREEFFKLIKATVINKKVGVTWSIWWPEKARDDLKSVRVEG